MSENDLSTFEGRVNHIKEILTDPTLALTPREALLHYYHWVMYEYHEIRSKRHWSRHTKHGSWLNKTEEVLRFRKELSEL
jgi:hypothetical protein